MRKWIALLLVLVMVLSLCACGGPETSSASFVPEASISSFEGASTSGSAVSAEDIPAESEFAEVISVTEETSTAEDELTTSYVTVLNNAGETETMNSDELMQINSNNEMKFENNYIGAPVIITSVVESVETNETIFVGDYSYSLKVLVRLTGGWLVSLPSTNTVVENLNVGDTVRVLGTITGMRKYYDEIAVINTNGHTTAITKYDEESDAITFFAMLSEMSGSDYFEDTVTFAQYYMDTYPDEIQMAETLNSSIETIKQVCYEETYVKKYDKSFSTIESVEEVSVEQMGIGYDYYDSNMYVNVQTYAAYLKNQGFTQGDRYMNINVNGVEETYLYFVNDNQVTVAMGQGDGYVRIIVFS